MKEVETGSVVKVPIGDLQDNGKMREQYRRCGGREAIAVVGDRLRIETIKPAEARRILARTFAPR